MDPSYSDLQACAVRPNAPLVIVDVDEVLAQFMAGFGAFIARHGFELRFDRYALFQNIYRPGETQHVDLIAGKALFDDFFRDGADDLLPADGAADALADLSTRAGVVILTNAPEHGRQSRSRWLKTHGFDYPLVINSGPKGPPAADLAARTNGPSVFIDDLLPQLESVAQTAPGVSRFQMVADARLRPLAPCAPERHTRIDLWPDLKVAIEHKLFP
jgi:phosphoglycolate phosphatase-like HAD superfamily hydrolase